MVTEKRPQTWHLKAGDFEQPTRHAKQDWRFLMWFEYLRISPSYLLATQCTNESELAELLGDAADAACVWRTYCDFGNVYDDIFRSWWQKRGFYLFGVETARPRVAAVTQLHGAKSVNDLADESGKILRRYISTAHVQQGRQDCLLVSIPLGINRTAALKQLKQMLDQVEPKAPSLPKAPYEVETNKMQMRRLKTGLRLVYMKSARPKDEMWRAAIRAKVSKVAHTKLDPLEAKNETANVEARRIVTIMASRLIHDTLLISENAARGKFPSLAECNKQPFDYERIGKRLKASLDAEKLLKDAIAKRAIKKQSP